MVRYSSGQRGQTVNLLRKLRRFESFPHHFGSKFSQLFQVLNHLKYKTKLDAGVAQLVEHQPSKLTVAGSTPVSRSTQGRCSSGVERFLGKEEVTGSIPVIGSKESSKK